MNVGLIGKYKSGKTTLANLLKERYSQQYNVVIMPFAKYLKEIVTKCSGLDDSAKDNTDSFSGNIKLYKIDKDLKKYDYDLLTKKEEDTLKALEYLPTNEMYRKLLQFIGTDIYRKRNEYHWIQLFENDFNKIKYNKNTRVIIDDVRFENEFQFALQNMDYVVKIVRPSEDKNDSHGSESEQDSFNVENIIINDKNLSDKELKDFLINEIVKIESRV